MLLAAFAIAHSTVSKEISFTGVEGFKLKGTFEAPAGASGMKALLLLPGSGPTDRDGNQPPGLITDLLKQIADNLAAHGIASFRFDKRAAHVYSAAWPKDLAKFNDLFSWDKFVGDARVALDLLRAQPGVDSGKVGILGHSEGTLIALQVAKDAPNGHKPAMLVLIGAPGRNMADIIRNQIGDLLHQQTQDPATIKLYMDATNKSIAQIEKTATVPTDVPAGLAALFNPTVGKLLQSYFRLDPPAMAKSYPGPVLLMNGAMDSQVSATKDFPLLESAFKSRPKSFFTGVIVPGASHNLKPAKSLLDPAFAGLVVPSALEDISKFANKS